MGRLLPTEKAKQGCEAALLGAQLPRGAFWGRLCLSFVCAFVFCMRLLVLRAVRPSYGAP